MTRKKIITLTLVLGILTWLFWSNKIDLDDVQQEFHKKHPELKFISAVDTHYCEGWDIIYKDKNGKIKREFWQVRDVGLFFSDIQVVIGG